MDIIILDKETREPLAEQREPVDGDLIMKVFEYDEEGNPKRFITKDHVVITQVEETSKPSISIGAPTIPESEKRGHIHWLGIRESFTVTASVTDDDNIIPTLVAEQNNGNGTAEFTVIAEQIINGDNANVVGDERFIGVLTENQLLITSINGFEKSGNYVFTQNRLNEGLASIEAGFEVKLDTVEFDIMNN